MCGRYGIYGDVTDEYRLKPISGYKFKPNYNVSPSQIMPVILQKDGNKQLEYMQWGIHRVVGPDKEKDIINTRSDKALGRFWGKTIREHRCLIPANGFYEWQTTSKGKTPFWIHPKNAGIFSFAGIYSTDNEGRKQYSIMTTEPNREMSEIHNRMPVILDKQEEDSWLFAEDKDTIVEFLHPYHDGGLALVQVSTDVNNPRNNNSTLYQPVKS
ncbi:SOS response-associated peptidase [Candidatus Saccharibacteria bacterium]|nr:SOS response-associated peptidase [Candidatus Saccharibacteria bacterium]